MAFFVGFGDAVGVDVSKTLNPSEYEIVHPGVLVRVAVRVRVGVIVLLNTGEGVNVNNERGVLVARNVDETNNPGVLFPASGVVVHVGGIWRRVGVSDGLTE